MLWTFSDREINKKEKKIKNNFQFRVLFFFRKANGAGNRSMAATINISSYPGLLVMAAGYLVTKFLKEIK